jgi:hypothetical protein
LRQGPDARSSIGGSAALQPRGELGLQVEPDPQRRVAEYVVHDPELVDAAALRAAEQRVRVLTGDRRQRHRPALAQLGAQLRGAVIGVALARAVGKVSVGPPAGGIVEVAGPEQFRLDELIRQGLGARNDPRQVVPDPEARYFGAKLTDTMLLPGPDAQLGETRFEDWLRQQVAVSS